MTGQNCPPPRRVMDENGFGVLWDGHYEALNRLVLGLGFDIGDALLRHGVAPEDAGKLQEKLVGDLYTTLSVPAMPIEDAIDLARFLVETTIGFVRFAVSAEVGRRRGGGRRHHQARGFPLGAEQELPRRRHPQGWLTRMEQGWSVGLLNAVLRSRELSVISARRTGQRRWPRRRAATASSQRQRQRLVLPRAADEGDHLESPIIGPLDAEHPYPVAPKVEAVGKVRPPALPLQSMPVAGRGPLQGIARRTESNVRRSTDRSARRPAARGRAGVAACHARARAPEGGRG